MQVAEEVFDKFDEVRRRDPARACAQRLASVCIPASLHVYVYVCRCPHVASSFTHTFAASEAVKISSAPRSKSPHSDADALLNTHLQDKNGSLPKDVIMACAEGVWGV